MEMLQWGLLRVFFRLNNLNSAFFHRRGAPAPWPPLWPSSWPVPTVLCLSCTKDSRAGCSWRWDLTRVEVEKTPISQPAGHNFDTVQGTVGFLGCKCIVPIHSEFFVYQYLQVLLHRAAPNLFTSSPCWFGGLPQPRCGTLLLALLNFMRLTWAHTSRLPKSRSSDSFGLDDDCKSLSTEIFYFWF